jgi:quercetin dioxygenase-like cupin family protein
MAGDEGGSDTTDDAAGSLVDIAPEEPYPGVLRRTIEGDGASVVFYRMEPGAQFPQHRHPQEQITIVRKGTLRMRIGAVEHDLHADDFNVIPGGVEHGISAGPEGASFLIVLTPRRAPGEEIEMA